MYLYIHIGILKLNILTTNGWPTAAGTGTRIGVLCGGHSWFTLCI